MTDTALNGINRDALRETIEAFGGDPSLAAFTFRVRNRWMGGMETRSDVDDYFGVCEERRRESSFGVASDQPAVLLGTDAAPNGVEYLLHALASDLTATLVRLATSRGVWIATAETRVSGPINLLSAFVENTQGRADGNSLEIHMTVGGEAEVADLEALCGLACRQSAVYTIVTAGMSVAMTAAAETTTGANDLIGPSAR